MAEPIKLAQNVDLENQLLQLGVDPLEVEQTIQENNPYEDTALSEQFRQSAMDSYIKTKAETPMQPKIQPQEPNIYDSLLKSMGQQEQYVDTLKKRLEEQKQDSGLQYLDLRPFAQALRSYGVSVEDPSAPMDRRSAMQALEDKIQQASLGLTKEQVNYLRAKALNTAKEKSSSLAEQKFELSKKKAQDVQDRFERNFGFKLTGRAGAASKNYLDRWDTLDREITAIKKSENFNSPMFASAQITIKNAISSLPGGGTGEERKKQYLENLNTILAEFEGKFTNDLDTIPRDSPEVVHLLNLAGIVQEDLAKQAVRRASSAMMTSPEAFKKDLKTRIEKDQGKETKKPGGIMSPEEFMKSRSKK